MEFKRDRLGPLLLRRAAEPGFLQQAHVVFGGTGAVGGATVFQLIGLFDELARRGGAPSEDPPRIVVTGRSKQEVRQFTRRFFRLQERDHGTAPEHVPGRGYRSKGGVMVELTTLPVDPTIPDLADFFFLEPADRRARMDAFLASGGLGPDAPLAAKLDLLRAAIAERVGRPFAAFLEGYRARQPLPGGAERFRSVTVGIPLASVATYKLRDLEAVAEELGLDRDRPELTELKASYLRAIRDDLAYVAEALSDEVLVAHTTAVGGMYDEEDGGERTIRLGFAHSALGERLRDKQLFAEELTRLYSERGIKMLITAAAIGVDAILVRKSPPVNGAIRAKLRRARGEGQPVFPPADLGQVHVYRPEIVDLLTDSADPLAFDQLAPLVVDYVVKSGENGFFSVSNADALYRVMRVTSSSELGHVLARTAFFGDDPRRTFFPDNVCYFTETDNSRQVFDLLNQPELRQSQLSGLQPKALQDLGSAKHQAELHTLGLLILLHRLRTLELHAIHPGVDLAAFDAAHFFEQNSAVVTLERVVASSAAVLSDMLTTLVTARDAGDLAPLKRFFQADPRRQEAAHRVLQAVLRSVWAIPSLGTPILFETNGQRRVVTGSYAAPIDQVLTHRSSLGRLIRADFDARGGGDEEAFERFCEFTIANSGFVDLRRVAVLVTARSAKEGLEGRVQVFRDESSFLEALGRIEPYSYFATSGLIALLVRLKSLWRAASELRLDLGSDNGFRAHLPRDEHGDPLLVPGVVEAFRMVAEGLEKNTGFERLDGPWGYGLQ